MRSNKKVWFPKHCKTVLNTYVSRFLQHCKALLVSYVPRRLRQLYAYDLLILIWGLLVILLALCLSFGRIVRLLWSTWHLLCCCVHFLSIADTLTRYLLYKTAKVPIAYYERACVSWIVRMV